MPGRVDRPPDLVRELRSMKARIAELEGRLLGRIAAGRQFAGESAEVSTTSASPVSLGGPSITVIAPEDAFIAVFAQAELHISGANPLADVYLYEATDMPSGLGLLETGNVLYTLRRSGGGSSFGTHLWFPASAGTRTYELRYAESTGTGTAFFRERKLWIEVF